MRATAILFGLLVGLGATGPVAAQGAAQGQQPPSATAQAAGREAAEPRLRSELRVAGMRFGNFFQAPDGAAQRDVDAAQGELRLAWRMDESLSLRGSAIYTAYGDGLEDSPGLGLALRSEGERHEWGAGVEWRDELPVFDLGEGFGGTAEVLRASADYAFRLTRAWQLGALGEWERQEIAGFPGRDNEATAVGAAVRYRGWGSAFSPELGVESGRRDATDPNEDFDQRDVWLRLRSAPTADLYLSFRARQRDREYDVATPAASNFGREDDRRDYTLSADYRLTGNLGLNLYANFLDAGSTKPSREFESSMVLAGVTWGW